MKKRKLHLFLTIVSIILSLITVVGFCVGFSNSQKTTETLNRYDYEYGYYDLSTQKFNLSKQKIVTEDFYSITSDNYDLYSINVSEDAECNVVVIYFMENNELPAYHSSLVPGSEFTLDYNYLSSENYTRFKVQIEPMAIDGEQPTLNVFNIGKYVDMVTVTVAK